MNRDAFNSAPLPQVRQAGMTVLDQLQAFSPEVQTLTLAVLFRLTGEHLNMPLQDAFTAAGNLIHEGTRRKQSEITALKAYIEGEL